MEIPRVIHWECIEEMKLLPDQSIDLILTDPPYKYLNHKLDRVYDENEFIKQAYRILKKDGMIVFFGRWYYLSLLLVTAVNHWFKFLEEVVRDKILISSPFLALGRVHELIIICSKWEWKLNSVKIPYLEMREQEGYNWLVEDIKKIKSALKNKEEIPEILKYIDTSVKTYSMDNKGKHLLTSSQHKEIKRSFWTIVSLFEGMKEKSIIRVNKEHYKFEHPTQKPVKLMERLLDLVSKPWDIILDPFAGSGSTWIACMNKDRKSILIEIDEEYNKVIEDRIKEKLDNTNPTPSGLFEIN